MTRIEYIASQYLNYVKRNNRYPNYRDLKALGITTAAIKYHFGGIKHLQKLMVEKAPKYFAKVKDTTKVTPEDAVSNILRDLK